MAARQLTLRGMDAAQQNDWATAEELFREAVAASPHDERAHFQFAKALWHAGDRPQAVTHMREAVRLSGNASELLVELGTMQLAMGDWEAARRSGMEAARLDREFAAAHALVGDALAREGRLDQALESYHLSLALDARQPQVMLAVADIYRTWDEPRRVLSTLQSISADSLPPALASHVYLLRGAAEKQLGRSSDAVENLAKARQILPTPDVHYELAAALQQTGEFEAAKRALEAALDRDPSHEASRALLAQLNTMPRLATGATTKR